MQTTDRTRGRLPRWLPCCRVRWTYCDSGHFDASLMLRTEVSRPLTQLAGVSQVSLTGESFTTFTALTTLIKDAFVLLHISCVMTLEHVIH